MKAVEELNYKPDLIARSMTTNETMQLSVVLNDFSNPFYGEIVHGFENTANEHGYFVSICTGFNNLDDYFENYILRRIDGVFLTAMPYHFDVEKIYKLAKSGVKIVVSGNVDADLKIVSSLESDHMLAMSDAMQYLYNLGHRDIAFLCGLTREMKFDRRIAGYLSMVEKLHLPCGDSLLLEGKFPYSTDVDDGYKMACRLIEMGCNFTAVICLNDLMAMGASNAFQERGYRIPQDVSLIGFDEILYSKFWNPPLTTMAMQKFEFGAKAFDMLYTNIKNDTTSFYMNKLHLVERQSTAICR
jgi:DNA-binding LacI/PurR family transcriptional regulator